MSSESTARVLRGTNPARLERWFLSDLNPWMLWVKSMAETVRTNRRPVSPKNPFAKVERDVSGRIEQALDQYRDARDDISERMFKAIYESPWLAALVGLNEMDVRRRGPQRPTWEHEELQRLKREVAGAHIEQGSVLDGWIRLVIYAERDEEVIDERPFSLVRRMIDELAPERRPSMSDLKAAVKRQAFVVALDEERAIAALPKLLPEMQQRRRAIDAARLVARTRGELSERHKARFRRLEQSLALDSRAQEQATECPGP